MEMSIRLLIVDLLLSVSLSVAAQESSNQAQTIAFEECSIAQVDSILGIIPWDEPIDQDGSLDLGTRPPTPIVVNEQEGSILSFSASTHSTFDYFIVDSSCTIYISGTITLTAELKDVVSTISLSDGFYTIILRIGSCYYRGEFVVAKEET